ncbi:MAG: hypothetical protein ACT4QC_14880 [Planctomycetaceae bacterium]
MPPAAPEDGLVFPRGAANRGGVTSDAGAYPVFRSRPVATPDDDSDDESVNRRPSPRNVTSQATALATAARPRGRQSQPANMVEPRSLQSIPQLAQPPVGTVYVKSAQQDLAIVRLTVCREVAGFDDVRELDATRLHAGQKIALYAALANFQSQATREGYRTQTRSHVEIRDAAGRVVCSEPQRDAVDLCREPRHDYALAHDMTIPVDLPPGDYVLRMCIHDVLAARLAHAELPISIQGGS